MKFFLFAFLVCLSSCKSLQPETLAFPFSISHNLETDVNTLTVGITPLWRLKPSQTQTTIKQKLQ